ncbi:MAG: 4Fe-4S binding protein [Methanomicrobiales archaeon]|nr:4Fe-4S binding protein [Methanomicrobiales archaeon]
MAAEQFQMVGLIYAVAGAAVVAYLLATGRFTRRVGYLFLILSVLLGFLILSPLAPLQFQEVLAGAGTGVYAPLLFLAVILAVFIAITLIAGRVFCGYLCPIGAVQEAASRAPVPKEKTAKAQRYLILFRLAFLAVLVAAALFFSMALLRFFGIREFFSLEVASVSFFVFLVLLAVASVIYRPFCRLFCPIGAILALAASRARMKLRRTKECINCGKCDVICPTGEAGKNAAKAECYLCGRCLEVCPREGALRYGKV